MLTWIDHLVISAYLVAMLVCGFWIAGKQDTDEEYFLGGRRLPWFAVGLSVIASLLSSLTYLSEPGEAWNSGITNVLGKLLAIPLEMLIVFFVCIPFMMKFRFTSAYEYLGHRFGTATRRLGTGLFLLMVVLWMGFVVLASSRALATVSGFSLETVIATVGMVTTIYTVLGGMRAVVWTDVVQVVLLIGGGVAAIGYVAWVTDSGLLEWYATAQTQLRASGNRELPLISFDPYVRATVFTVGLNMYVWHVATHTANQMTVQRYFSTKDTRAARRSFVTGSLFGVGINLMLLLVGLAMVHYYFGQDVPMDGGLDITRKQDRDLIFPTFATHRMPPGFGGGIIAALLAAGMSSIDSGISSIATVVCVELQGGKDGPQVSQVKLARWITLFCGLFITAAAYGLNFLPGQWGIIDAMPRTFNAVTGPLGGLFLIGMFLPRASQSVAILATALGLATSLGLGYFEQIGELFVQAGWLTQPPRELSFTWIMPCAITVTFVAAWLMSLFAPAPPASQAGLTWWSRHTRTEWE